MILTEKMPRAVVPADASGATVFRTVDQSVRGKVGARANQGSAGTVRPFEERDLASIVALYERVMSKEQVPPHALLSAYLSQVLLHHPWRNDGLPSLVFEDGGGEITGCLGVMPRPMSFQGRPIIAAISHSFIVEPGKRSALVALELAKAFLSGPQDLSMAESGGVSRRIWEKFGGHATLLYSLCWTRPLQPTRYALSFLRRRGLPSVVGSLLHPICRAVDACASLVGGPFRFRAPVGFAAELDAPMLPGLVAEYAKERALRPQYNEHSADWLLQTMAQNQGRGRLHGVAVQDDRRETIGWYLYYGSRGAVGTVVQVGASKSRTGEVLDHLFHHARRQGLIAVSGQVDPGMFSDLAGKHCLFHHDGGSLLLVHSRHPEVLQAIDQGDAFLTRLEGEWWISSFLS